jgi:dTDP-4-dehydrorhamnose 3,5-epimerase
MRHDVPASPESTHVRILEIHELAIPDVRVVRFARFADDRGYFTESYRRSDVEGDPDAAFLHGLEFVQVNESHSSADVVRGLHFQWNPYMGKLVRTVSGRMVDLVLDIRLGSPTFGMIVAHDMPSEPAASFAEWIWVPPGFAHGNFFTEATTIEYFCTGEYSPGCEGAVSPLADDLDWSLCDPGLRREFQALLARGPVVSDKDREAGSVGEWADDSRSANFRYGQMAVA